MLMPTFMDEVSFNAKGDEVTMVKRCPVPQMSAPASRVIDIQREGDVVVLKLLRDVTALTDDHLVAEFHEAPEELPDCEAKHAVVDLHCEV